MTGEKINGFERYNYDSPTSLEGATLYRVLTGEHDFEQAVFFVTDRGCFVFYHRQDCCENVYLSEMTGGPVPSDGAVIRLAEVRTESGEAEWGGSWTATFYAIRTDGPDIDMHWQGESNSYYSEDVSVELIDAAPDSATEYPWEAAL